MPKLDAAKIAMFRVFDILYPDRQLYYEVECSSGHAKIKYDGWNVGKINVWFGGKQQSKMRDSEMLPGCVLPDSILQVGDTQVFLFTEVGISHMYPNAQKEDYKLQQTIPSRRRDLFGPTVQLEIVKKEGNMNKPKGSKHILYEHGLLDETTRDKSGMVAKLGTCINFSREVSQIQELFHSQGHIIGFTPNFLPKYMSA